MSRSLLGIAGSSPAWAGSLGMKSLLRWSRAVRCRGSSWVGGRSGSGLVWDQLSAARLLSTQHGVLPEPITDFGREPLSLYRAIARVEVPDLPRARPPTTWSCGCKESTNDGISYSRTTFIAMRSCTSTSPRGRPSLSRTGISSIRRSLTSRTASRTRA